MDWERRLILRLQDHAGGGALLAGVRALTLLGDWYAWLALVPYVILKYTFWGFLKMLLHCGGLGFLSILACNLIKRNANRPRPYAKDNEIRKWLTPHDEFAFPSGHTMNNMAAGLAFSIYEPWFFPFAVAIPLVWGSFRTVLGVHYPTDVIAGGVLAFALFFASQLFPISAVLFPG